MNFDIADAAIRFLMRSTLSGQEVPAFNAVMKALDDERRRANPSAEIAATNYDLHATGKEDETQPQSA